MPQWESLAGNAAPERIGVRPAFESSKHYFAEYLSLRFLNLTVGQSQSCRTGQT